MHISVIIWVFLTAEKRLRYEKPATLRIKMSNSFCIEYRMTPQIILFLEERWALTSKKLLVLQILSNVKLGVIFSQAYMKGPSKNQTETWGWLVWLGLVSNHLATALATEQHHTPGHSEEYISNHITVTWQAPTTNIYMKKNTKFQISEMKKSKCSPEWPKENNATSKCLKRALYRRLILKLLKCI